MHIVLTLLEERLYFDEHSGKVVSMLWERSLLAGIDLLYTARLQTSICVRTEEGPETAPDPIRSELQQTHKGEWMASSRALAEEKQLVKAWEQSHAQQVSGTHKQQREHIWREKERDAAFKSWAPPWCCNTSGKLGIFQLKNHGGSKSLLLLLLQFSFPCWIMYVERWWDEWEC